MKKIFTFLLVSILAINVMAFDWRDGKYLVNPPEYLFSINPHGKMMLGDNAELNPWGFGFTMDYLYKTGRKQGYTVSTAHGVGGHLGLTYFRGVNIDYAAVGALNMVTFDKYNSYNYVPIMLTYNFFITAKRSHYILGVDAGVNMMIRERDYFDGEELIFYDGEGLNPYDVTRFLPTASAYFAYMYELTTNIRLKAQVGADYIMGYKFDGKKEIHTIHVDEDTGVITPTSQIIRHKMETDHLLNLSISLGFVYSL